jgi:GDP-L-fucose synthase
MENTFFKDKLIAVSGGSGFLGTHYINELIKRGAKVRTHTHKSPIRIKHENVEVLQNLDLTKYEDCLALTNGADYVIHAAGNILHPSTVATDVSVTLNQIIIITNLLEASHNNKVKRFVDLNSSTGYPDRRYLITEQEYYHDEPFISYFGYGQMRRYREKLMEHISHFSDMKILIARGSAIFGPEDNFDLKTCHVVPALIKRLLSGENPFIVWGSPDVVRDFLYVKDVVKGVLLVLEKGQNMRPYNLGYGEGITIGHIVDSLLEITNISTEVKWDNTKPTTIPFRAVSVDRIQNELGFTPDYTFKDGLRETIDWYLKNKTNAPSHRK